MPLSLASTSFWRAAVRIAWRDLCFSRRRAFAVIFAVATGVAAVSAVRTLAGEMRSKVRGNAREWIAADLYVRLEAAPSDEETAALASLLQQGVEQTRVTEIHGIVSSSQVPDPALVFVKVVDPARYPFYGTVELRPANLLRQVLSEDSIVVSRNLAEDMQVKVGDLVRVGRAEFRVAAVIVAEPDWSGGLSTVLPRVLLTPEGFARSGLALQGQVVRKLLFRIGKGSLAAVRQRLEEIFPDADVGDYRDPDPSAAVTFDEAAGYFVVVAWMALAIGSLAVAIIMHLHIQQRMQAVAVMKALGARSNQILAIYSIQSLGLALAGGVVGALAAQPLQHVLAAVALRLLPVHLAAQWHWTYIAEPAGAAVLAAIASVVGPLLRLRGVAPLAVLRRHMTARPWIVPRRFVPLHSLPLELRLGMRNVFRPGNHSAAIVLALSAGVAMLSATYLCQREITGKVMQSVPARGSNLYLISTGRQQLDEATAWLAGQPGVESRPEAFPLISLRLDRINGAAVPARSNPLPRMWLATCSDETARGEVVPSHASEVLHLKAGDLLEFSSKGRVIRRRVARRTASDLDEVISLLTFPCDDFDALPVYYHAAVRVKASQEAAVRRALAVRYPGLPTLSRAEFTGLVQKIAGETAKMLQLASWAILVIGVVLGILLIAAGKRIRLEEIAVAKVLGARPHQLQNMYLCEFGLLGLFAGTTGGALGTILASLLLTAMLHQTIILFAPGVVLVAAGLTVVLAAAAGGLAGAGMMRRKPLQILREEG